jgi:hypothetical protein
VRKHFRESFSFDFYEDAGNRRRPIGKGEASIEIEAEPQIEGMIGRNPASVKEF